MKTYRIKTEAEFEKEFGKKWRDNVECTWASPEMDYLHGKLIAESEIEWIYSPFDPTYFNITKDSFWSISKGMITEIEPAKQKGKLVGYVEVHDQLHEVAIAAKKTKDAMDVLASELSGFFSMLTEWDAILHDDPKSPVPLDPVVRGILEKELFVSKAVHDWNVREQKWDKTTESRKVVGDLEKFLKDNP